MLRPTILVPSSDETAAHANALLFEFQRAESIESAACRWLAALQIGEDGAARGAR